MYLRNGAIPKQPGKQPVDIRWILNKKIEELNKEIKEKDRKRINIRWKEMEKGNVGEKEKLN